MKIEQGQIRIEIEDLVRDPEILKEIAKHAIFSELLIHAVAQVLVSGQVQWPEEDTPWWCGHWSQIQFESARLELAKLAEEGTRSALDEMKGVRDAMETKMKEYQTRAWEAERMVRAYAAVIKPAAQDARDLLAVDRISNQGG